MKSFWGIVVALALLGGYLVGCYDTTKPPPKCANIMNCAEDPTAYPPLRAQHTDGGADAQPSKGNAP